ncbi:ComF family protein [Tundrisphaera lichenicola]|uniref:ComF family protein n=1 Tax=Tundrisphaera lichenicola TaxID=2029860 RepID=UPI003EBCFC3B
MGRAVVSAGRVLRGCWDQAGRAVDALAFPPTCPVCDASTDGPAFCEDCRVELLGASGVACPRCAMPVGPHADVAGGCSECRGRSLGFDRAIALGPYQGPIRQLCLSLKHERNAWMARWVAEILAERRSGSLVEEAEARPLIVPVPLHWRKRLRRGYNQAEALAVGLGRSLRLEVRPGLRRVVATPKLALAGRTERARLMRQAFRARGLRGLRGRPILLVDDILTTGATAGAAARALKRAGASRVVVVVVARAEGKP